MTLLCFTVEGHLLVSFWNVPSLGLLDDVTYEFYLSSLFVSLTGLGNFWKELYLLHGSEALGI